MTELRVGIAGYGVVGKRRKACVARNPRLRVVAVCDRLLEEGSLLPDGVRCHADYRQVLGEELDVLIVCLTNDIAAEVTMAGLQRGLHVFCEKPPGRDMADIARVIR